MAGNAPITFIDDRCIHATLPLKPLASFQLPTLSDLPALLDLTDLTVLDHAELEQVSYLEARAQPGS